MSVKQIIKFESDAVTGQPVRIPFEFSDLSSLPEGKKIGDSIVIQPLTVRTWFKLKPYLILIDKKDIDSISAKQGVEFDSELEEIINKYDELLFNIVCIGVHNKKDNMPEWFKEVLKDNCTWQDIYILLNAILFRIGTTSFSNSITALQAVSPLSEEEIIALQKNKEKWNLKAASRS
ncbi:MAG: hypothetical protein ACK5LF_14615 [Bacteroides xylanisolvens]